MADNLRRLSKGTKLAFGIGSAGEVIFLGMMNSFVGIFYNQAIGLSNSLIGTAIMLAMLSDAVSDPIIGMLSDRWRSKLGRRHPFLYAAPLPLALALYLIFNPPESLTGDNLASNANQWLLFAWLAFWTALSRVFLTMYVIPHLALGGEMTQDANERSRLFSINALCGYMSGALFAFAAWGVFLGGESLNANGDLVPRHLDPTAYGPLVYTACGIALATIWLCAWGTSGQIQHLSKAPPAGDRPNLKMLYGDLAGPLKNRNYLFLVIGFFFFMISIGLNETFGVFVNTYYWELATEQIRWYHLVGVPAIIVGASIAPMLMRRFDRKPILVLALTGMAIHAQLPIDLRLMGLFPDNSSPYLLPLLLANHAGLSFFVAISGVAVMAMLGDISDEIELENGKRQEGLVYSARAFFAKASNSAGHFFGGIMLDAFVALPFEAVPGEVDPDVVNRLGLSAGPIMGVSALTAIFFYMKYDLTKQRHAEILEKLAARKSENAQTDTVSTEQSEAASGNRTALSGQEQPRRSSA